VRTTYGTTSTCSSQDKVDPNSISPSTSSNISVLRHSTRTFFKEVLPKRALQVVDESSSYSILVGNARLVRPPAAWRAFMPMSISRCLDLIGTMTASTYHGACSKTMRWCGRSVGEPWALADAGLERDPTVLTLNRREGEVLGSIRGYKCRQLPEMRH